MEITWYGRACFRLKGREATVITDPCPPSTGFVAGKHDVDLLTISHAHPDHAYTRSITAGLTLTRPGEYEYRDLLVIGVRAFHDGERGQQRGENMIFAVEIDGVHICHLGDLGHLLSEGSLNTNGIYGLRASLELLLEAGIETIAEYVVALATRFADRLEEIGWRVGSPRPIRSGIVGAIPPGVEPSLLRWHRLLEENGVVCAPREGMLRFSPHLFNEDAEVDKVIELLARA
jgi:hypothetical protein